MPHLGKLMQCRFRNSKSGLLQQELILLVEIYRNVKILRIRVLVIRIPGILVTYLIRNVEALTTSE